LRWLIQGIFTVGKSKTEAGDGRVIPINQRVRTDLRHKGCTRMLERGVPFPVVSEIMGWSASSTIRMAKSYAHIGNAARRESVEELAPTAISDSEGPQK
jgi:integrase